MTELIVALDLPYPDTHRVFYQLRRETEVQFFKVNARNILEYARNGISLVSHLRSYDVDVFLDLKVYDTRDTVALIAGEAFVAGASFLTVHATPSMLEAAMAAKTRPEQKVLAVNHLTDGAGDLLGQAFGCADGGVMTAASADQWRKVKKTRIIICPGIRPMGQATDNHQRPATPAEARDAGADYIVVGRPITNAPDPVAAARAIIEELNDA